MTFCPDVTIYPYNPFISVKLVFHLFQLFVVRSKTPIKMRFYYFGVFNVLALGEVYCSHSACCEGCHRERSERKDDRKGCS